MRKRLAVCCPRDVLRVSGVVEAILRATDAVQVYQDPQAKPVAGAEEALQLIDGPVGAPAAELSVVSRGAHGGAHRRGTRGWGAG